MRDGSRKARCRGRQHARENLEVRVEALTSRGGEVLIRSTTSTTKPPPPACPVSPPLLVCGPHHTHTHPGVLTHMPGMLSWQRMASLLSFICLSTGSGKGVLRTGSLSQ